MAAVTCSQRTSRFSHSRAYASIGLSVRAAAPVAWHAMLQTTARQHAASFFPALGGDLPTIVRAEGIYLYDDAGRAIIDAAGGVGAVTSVGHAVPEVVDAIAAQLRTVAFVPWTQFQSEPAQRLAEAVAEMTPRGLNGVALFNSGSEVTEGAVKLARQYWLARGKPDKHLVVSRWQGFHGMTLGASGFSGHTQRRRKYQPMIHDMPKIGPAYAYRCADCASGSLRCADELERVIRWHGPENVACFIAEPVVGATMGAVPAPPGYFQRIREICDRHAVLVLADGASSWCRTAPHEHRSRWRRGWRSASAERA